jgi:carbon storage regulator CsrA
MSSLTLSRELNESIVIFTRDGDQVTLTINKLSPTKVAINFEAPKGVEIWRDELLEDDEN